MNPFKTRRFGSLFRATFVGLVTVVLTACFDDDNESGQSADLSPPLHPPYGRETAPNLKVAFLGDHGTSVRARAVFELIKAEEAGLIVSQGDLGYDHSPSQFFQLLDEVLGPDFPFLASLGNHDRPAASRYLQILEARASRLGEARCVGQLAVLSACNFRGLLIINSSLNVLPREPASDHAEFINAMLAESSARWRICSWHLTQAAMQLGEKVDEAGWQPYEACREGGAIILTAHDHVYGRTHPISEISDEPRMAPRNGPAVEITPGTTIAIVSGIGGASLYYQVREAPWWAAVYTKTQDNHPGALFYTFNPDGRAKRADCYFMDIRGGIADRFTLAAPG